MSVDFNCEKAMSNECNYNSCVGGSDGHGTVNNTQESVKAGAKRDQYGSLTEEGPKTEVGKRWDLSMLYI